MIDHEGRNLRKLEEATRAQDVELLVAKLSEAKRPKHRSNIVIALTRTRTIDAVAPLQGVLTDRTESDQVRALAARGLGQVGNVSAVTGLIAAARSEANTVRMWSAWSLGAIADDRAAEPLIDLSRDSDVGVRAYAAEALGSFRGRADVTEALIERLQDRKRLVRREAALSLVKMRAVEALPAMREAAANEPRMTRGLMRDAIARLERESERIPRGI